MKIKKNKKKVFNTPKSSQHHPVSFLVLFFSIACFSGVYFMHAYYHNEFLKLESEIAALRFAVLEQYSNETLVSHGQLKEIPSTSDIFWNADVKKILTVTLCVAGVLIVGAAANSGSPGLFSIKAIIPASIYSFIQKKTFFFQERAYYIVDDSSHSLVYHISVLNNTDVKIIVEVLRENVKKPLDLFIVDLLKIGDASSISTYLTTLFSRIPGDDCAKISEAVSNMF